jgi:hypothetical protein
MGLPSRPSPGRRLSFWMCDERRETNFCRIKKKTHFGSAGQRGKNGPAHRYVERKQEREHGTLCKQRRRSNLPQCSLPGIRKPCQLFLVYFLPIVNLPPDYVKTPQTIACTRSGVCTPDATHRPMRLPCDASGVHFDVRHGGRASGRLQVPEPGAPVPRCLQSGPPIQRSLAQFSGPMAPTLVWDSITVVMPCFKCSRSSRRFAPCKFRCRGSCLATLGVGSSRPHCFRSR